MSWREPRIAYRHKSYDLTVDYYLKLLRSLNVRIPHGVIVDVGCGRGYIVKFFAKVGLCCIGLDASKEMLRECKGIDVVLGDIRYLPFRSEIADMILCFDVLEHIKDVQKVPGEVRRVLKKKGHSVCTIPLKHPINIISDFLRGEKSHVTMLRVSEWLNMFATFFNINYKTVFILPLALVLFKRYLTLDLGFFNTHIWLHGVKKK